jgi:hypothetical protein
MKKLHPALEEFKSHPNFKRLLKDPALSWVLQLEDPRLVRVSLCFIVSDEKERAYLYIMLSALIHESEGRATKKEKEMLKRWRKQQKQTPGAKVDSPPLSDTARSI